MLAHRHGRRARARGRGHPGAAEFVQRLQSPGKRFLLLANNSIFTPRDLRVRLRESGFDVPEEAIWTSALATPRFIENQENPLMMRSTLNQIGAHSEPP